MSNAVADARGGWAMLFWRRQKGKEALKFDMPVQKKKKEGGLRVLEVA
jgi:hypothetical protein